MLNRCKLLLTSLFKIQSFKFRTFVKVTVDLQRPHFANFFFFVPDIAKISI